MNKVYYCFRDVHCCERRTPNVLEYFMFLYNNIKYAENVLHFMLYTTSGYVNGSLNYMVPLGRLRNFETCDFTYNV